MRRARGLDHQGFRLVLRKFDSRAVWQVQPGARAHSDAKPNDHSGLFRGCDSRRRGSDDGAMGGLCGDPRRAATRSALHPTDTQAADCMLVQTAGVQTNANVFIVTRPGSFTLSEAVGYWKGCRERTFVLTGTAHGRSRAGCLVWAGCGVFLRVSAQRRGSTRTSLRILDSSRGLMSPPLTDSLKKILLSLPPFLPPFLSSDTHESRRCFRGCCGHRKAVQNSI